MNKSQKQSYGTPQLGEKLTIYSVMDRCFSHPTEYRTEVTWQSQPLDKPIEGIYIGYRYVYDGVIHEARTDYWSGASEPATFEQKQSRWVWLMVLDERRNPIHVDPTGTSYLPF